MGTIYRFDKNRRGGYAPLPKPYFHHTAESLQMIDHTRIQRLQNASFCWLSSSTPPIAMPNAFAGVDMDLTTLYVPTDSIASYKASEGWNSFKNIRGRDDSDILVWLKIVIEIITKIIGFEKKNFFSLKWLIIFRMSLSLSVENTRKKIFHIYF